MSLKAIADSTAMFPFKQVKGRRGIKFRKTKKRKDGTGTVVEIDHNGHDHLTVEFRILYKTKSGKIGNRRLYFWTLDTKETVQLASILMYFADEHMRDSAESPFISIVCTKEKAGFGSNWIREDYESSIKRTEMRKARSHLFGLMKCCVETCEDKEFIEYLLISLAIWADRGNDEFALQQAEKAFFQLGLIPKEMVN